MKIEEIKDMNNSFGWGKNIPTKGLGHHPSYYLDVSTVGTLGIYPMKYTVSRETSGLIPGVLTLEWNIIMFGWT